MQVYCRYSMAPPQSMSEKMHYNRKYKLKIKIYKCLDFLAKNVCIYHDQFFVQCTQQIYAKLQQSDNATSFLCCPLRIPLKCACAFKIWTQDNLFALHMMQASPIDRLINSTLFNHTKNTLGGGGGGQGNRGSIVSSVQLNIR